MMEQVNPNVDARDVVGGNQNAPILWWAILYSTGFTLLCSGQHIQALIYSLYIHTS